MRILVAADSWFPDALGGAPRVTAETSRRLALRGHEVTVLAPAQKNAPDVEAGDGLILLRCLQRGLLPQTVSDRVAVRRQGRRLPGRFDLLVAHQMSIGAGLATGTAPTPLVLVYHASAVREARLRAESHSSAPRRQAGHALAAIAGRQERRALHKAHSVVVLSDYSRSLVSADHPEAAGRVVVVRGGVDTQRFSDGPRESARARLGIRDGETILLSVRRLKPGLGLETVLRSFRDLAPDDTTRLVVAGEGSLAGALHALATELGLDARVEFVGAPTQETLQEWYRAADLLVLPPAPHEGFGLSTIEALASGTPVVAAPVGANPELLDPLDSRLVARSASPQDLAAAIRGVLELAGPDLRRRCRRYAAARFDWDVVLDDWEKVLLAATEEP